MMLNGLVNMNKDICLPLFDKIISQNGIEKGDPIGKGGCGEIYIVGSENKNSKESKCDESKNLVMKKFKAVHLLYFLREIGFQNSVNHPYVLNLTGFIPFTKSKLEPILIMPYATKGTLLGYIPQISNLTKTEIYKLVYSICRALWFLHKLNIFHRDIKSENILIMEDNSPRISDFGFSKIKVGDGSNSIIVKSKSYAAPECYTQQTSYPSDVFSLAIVLYEIFEQKTIVSYYSTKVDPKKVGGRVIYNIYKDDQNRPNFTSNTPKIWQELISSMWLADSFQRPDMDYVIKQIEREEYFLDGTNKDELNKFIESVKKCEQDFYYVDLNRDQSFLCAPCQEELERHARDFFVPFDYSPVVLAADLVEKEAANVANAEAYQEDQAYKSYVHCYRMMVHRLFSLKNINNEDALVSAALYLMTEVGDYSSAVEVIKSSSRKNSLYAQNLLELIKLENKKSIFARAMFLETEGRYQEALEAYLEAIENGEMSGMSVARLGRLLAFFGSSPEEREEGEKLMRNAADLGDEFAAFNLGVFYFKKAKSDSERKMELLTMANECFEMAEDFPDVEMMKYLTYEALNDENMTKDSWVEVKGMYFDVE